MLHFLSKKRPFVKTLFILLFSAGLVVFVHAQENIHPLEDLYRYAEQIYSTDDLLVNGQIYIPGHSKADGSPYYGDNRFEAGTVIIKGRKFNGVLLKFNLEDQRLILRAAVEAEKYVTILLNPGLIDSFTLGGRKFVNINHCLNHPDLNGFYALVFDGSFTFLIKYKKSFIDVYSQQKPYGSYSNMYWDYYICKPGILENVTKKKALLNYFSPEKNKVKSFMRKYNIRYKKATVEQLNQLMKYCDFIVSK